MNTLEMYSFEYYNINYDKMGKFSFIFLITGVPTDYLNLFCSENGGTRATGGSPAAVDFLMRLCYNNFVYINEWMNFNEKRTDKKFLHNRTYRSR